MDAKKALEEGSTIEKAVEILRKKGHASLAKKSDRSAKEGIVTSYIHAGGKVGVLLELNCETDFVARNEEFKELATELALQVAATNPQYVQRSEVPQEVIDSEKSIYLEQISAMGGTTSGGKDKLENLKEQIVLGKLEKFYEQVCLLDQDYVREPEKKVKDIIAEKVGKLGENIQVRRFVRFVVGA